MSLMTNDASRVSDVLSASRLFKMTVQQGRRRSKNRRRTLWGTLRNSCELRTPLAGFFNSPLVQRSDGQRHFVWQQERHVRVVRGVRLNEGKQGHRLRHLARRQGQQNRKVEQRRHRRQTG